jgi:lipopolysaccharide assembly LptE-like protein
MRLRFLLAGCVLAGLTACAGYKLGPTNGLRAGEKSIKIAPFANQTIEPRLGEAATAALRKQIQRDGTYHLSTGQEADIVVSGEVIDLDRRRLANQPRDTLTARDYSLNITAKVVARERISGKEILNREVNGRTSIHVGADLNSSERQALPLLAEDLARNITALLVDGTW